MSELPPPLPHVVLGRNVSVASSSLAAKLVGLHFTPRLVGEYLRAFAWWSAWRAYAPAAASDFDQIPRFLQTLLAAGAVRHDVVAAVGVLNLIYQGGTLFTAGTWSARAPVRALGPDDVAALHRYAQHPGTRLAITLQHGLGLRQQEAFALTIADVDWRGQRVVVGQGAAVRGLPLDSTIAPELARALSRATTGLLQTSEGAPLPPKVFRADLAQSSVKAGLTDRGSPTALRHAYGARELRSGRDFRLLLMRLGLPGANDEVPHLGGAMPRA